jgi:cell division protease FtsH
MPHGVLLSGAPGTGKTLLARAVAGEAHAAFFSISASEFIEAIVGVGASRVRDLFAKAKEAAPAIIFIDELDAIGRSRQGSVSVTGANDEREQTLDQILTEMDGFESSEAVIVLAATNRPDVLDPALLRAGRFDRRVAVQPPDRKGRARNPRGPHALDPARRQTSTSDALAASTPGMVGADLANLANEAALLAARRGSREGRDGDFTDSLEKIMLGSPRGILLSPADRERTAYHESGHALVGMLTPGADPVRKVSIIPRGMALGVTLSTPDSDRVSYSLEDLQAKISVALGGRVAEEVVYGTITTGAESDIQQLTQIARQMVGRWGMSDADRPDRGAARARAKGRSCPASARQGAEVALVGRDAERVQAVAREARAAGGGAPVHEHVADLTLMADVRALAEEVRALRAHRRAGQQRGALFASRKETSEGFERTFALNHLAPFLLTNLLRDRLTRRARRDDGIRRPHRRAPGSR